MPKLIIVCGLPGSGKTMLSNELSRKLGIACIRKDSIKEKLYESMKLSTLEDSKRIGKPSAEVMFHLAEEQLANGVDVIIEAPFNFPEDYPMFEKWKIEYGLDLYAVICFINTSERKERFSNRLRHDAHHDHMLERIAYTFSEDIEKYDYATMPGKQIRIKTNEAVGLLAENVISQIN